MELAFAPGYDPALEMAASAKRRQAKGTRPEETAEHHLRRKEQDVVDRIISGAEDGHYFVLLGPKV